MRTELRLKWNNTFDPLNWSKADIEYAHVMPRKFISHHQVNLQTTQCITIVRNTYDRLVSCWSYGRKHSLSYALPTFDAFIRSIHSNRANLQVLPLWWMFAPIDKYFEGVPLDKIRFFDTNNLYSVLDYLKSRKLESPTSIQKTNSTIHNHYSSYYTPELVSMVQQVYAWELQRFKYRFDQK